MLLSLTGIKVGLESIVEMNVERFIHRRNNLKNKMVKRLAVFVDGGVTGNRICIAHKNGIELKQFKDKKTNNELEHLAIYEGVKFIKRKYKDQPCTILSDSLLAVNQVNGEWKGNDRLTKLAEKTRKILPKDIMIKWVPRRSNLAGIYLDYCLEHWLGK